MKMERSKFFFIGLLCVLMIVTCFLFVPIKVYADESGTPSIAVKNGESFIYNATSYPYPSDNNGLEKTLCVTNFVFQQNDSVAYYYIKQGTEQIAYTALDTVAYKDAENKTKCELTRDFFAKAGAGIYNIKAVILRNNQIFAFPKDFTLTIHAPVVNDSTWKKKIVMDNLGVWGGEYPTYNLTAQLLKNDQEVDISNYEISWYYSFNNQTHYFGSGESIYWSPNQSGDYVIKVEIDTGASGDLITQTTDTIAISQNYSMYAIIALSAFAVIITTIVVVAVVRKVKKERVW